VRHLNMVKTAAHDELGELGLIRSPINMSGFPRAERFERAGPDPGRDSAEVLAELGLSEAELAQLREDGVI